MRLQNEAGGNLAASDGRHELFQLGYLADIGTLVDQAANVYRQLAAVHIVGLVAKQVEKLGVAHGDQKVKRVVGVGHDEKQRRFAVAQRVQLQFVVGRDLPQLRDVERRKARAAGNQDGFCGLARDVLSRVFSSKNKKALRRKKYFRYRALHI